MPASNNTVGIVLPCMSLHLTLPHTNFIYNFTWCVHSVLIPERRLNRAVDTKNKCLVSAHANEASNCVRQQSAGIAFPVYQQQVSLVFCGALPHNIQFFTHTECVRFFAQLKLLLNVHVSHTNEK